MNVPESEDTKPHVCRVQDAPTTNQIAEGTEESDWLLWLMPSSYTRGPVLIMLVLYHLFIKNVLIYMRIINVMYRM